MTNNITVYKPVAPTVLESNKEGFKAAAMIPEELDVDPKRISDEINKLIKCIEEIQRPSSGTYEISEVEFNLVVTAKGKLALLGSGIESGVNASVKVKISKMTTPNK